MSAEITKFFTKRITAGKVFVINPSAEGKSFKSKDLRSLFVREIIVEVAIALTSCCESLAKINFGLVNIPNQFKFDVGIKAITFIIVVLFIVITVVLASHF